MYLDKNNNIVYRCLSNTENESNTEEFFISVFGLNQINERFYASNFGNANKYVGYGGMFKIIGPISLLLNQEVELPQGLWLLTKCHSGYQHLSTFAIIAAYGYKDDSDDWFDIQNLVHNAITSYHRIQVNYRRKAIRNIGNVDYTNVYLIQVGII